MRSLVVTFHRALPLALSFLCGSLLNDNDSDNDDDNDDDNDVDDDDCGDCG